MSEFETKEPTLEPLSGRDTTRHRILATAIDLLTREGRDAVTTRAVAEAAGFQAPVIYRLFGDKEGLLQAVAEYGFARYLRDKGARQPTGEPVEDLRAGWDLHIEFGVSNPALYLLMYADPRPGLKPPAAQTAWDLLRAHIRRVAKAGLLRVSEDQAAELYHASACGMVLSLLAVPAAHRDLRLSILAREAALATMLISASQTSNYRSETATLVNAATTLRAVLPAQAPLTAAERGLLEEWLDRLADT